MDRTTGSPAEFNGKMLTDLYRDDAEILAELLNEVPDPRTAIFRMFGGKI